ncbi:ion channel [Polynucleobacter sp. UK-Kesae-W10]|uniref:ion channel n=1 Tax=Polynucleobacter sp. UK-Kesae-W10 TaxID=1819738 RepID=UPI001C0DEA8B|nr:ion channel [Polynucleobacter sp. UK-Kesae-W10]MBU3576603.1 ATP-sensitive inward rectifier potassium channel 10 [Polynucleobacter sp. UK-Kesae-W10]
MDKNNFMATPVKRSSTSLFSNAFIDFYHLVVRMTWPRFLASFVMVFLAINLLFGFLYSVRGDSISGLKGLGFLEYFFFSVQTLATIGYGSMFPQTLYGHVLVTVEAMVGLLGVGMFAALAFARISLPRSRVVFSNTAVINNFEGQPALMFRMANERNNRIIGAEVELSLFIQETTKEGQSMRRIYDLSLARNHTPMLALTWLVIHPIDEKSPLSRMSEEDLSKADFALVATVKGLDETVSQTIHSNHTYTFEDIRWNHRFVDLYRKNESGMKVLIDQTLIHDTIEEAR